jgi:hypothetical protein
MLKWLQDYKAMSKIVINNKRKRSNGLRGFLITPGHESKEKN